MSPANLPQRGFARAGFADDEAATASLKIARPFMAGKTPVQFSESHQGRQNISFVPPGLDWLA